MLTIVEAEKISEEIRSYYLVFGETINRIVSVVVRETVDSVRCFLVRVTHATVSLEVS